MRLRFTAFPVFLVTVKPTRGGPSSPRLSTSTRNSRPRRFSPPRTARNSLRLRSRCGLVVPGVRPGNGRPSVRRRAACGRDCGERRRRRGHPWWPCGHGSRDGASARASRVDRCASFILIPRRAALLHSVADEQERGRANCWRNNRCAGSSSQRGRAYRKGFRRSQSVALAPFGARVLRPSACRSGRRQQASHEGKPLTADVVETDDGPLPARSGSSAESAAAVRHAEILTR